MTKLAPGVSVGSLDTPLALCRSAGEDARRARELSTAAADCERALAQVRERIYEMLGPRAERTGILSDRNTGSGRTGSGTVRRRGCGDQVANWGGQKNRTLMQYRSSTPTAGSTGRS